MGKELLSGSAAAKHAVVSVIQAAEKAQITTTSPELQLACHEGLGERGKKNLEERGGARAEIHLKRSGARRVAALSLVPEVYFHFHARHLSGGRLMKAGATFGTMKIIMSE